MGPFGQQLFSIITACYAYKGSGILLAPSNMSYQYGVNMTALGNQKGFTFTEIMIAVTIMALGFLAMAQMQFLSIRQRQQAEEGTVATNLLEFVADRDMEEVKRAQLLNSIAFMEAQAGRLDPGNASDPHLQYCSTSNSKRMCDACPCNPLKAVTSDLTNDGVDCDNPETACAVINVNNLNPENVDFSTNKADCNSSASDSLVIVKRVCVLIVDDDPNVPKSTTLNVTYGVKTNEQFAETGLNSLSKRDTLVTQDMVFSAHKEDWSQFIPSWTEVSVPHVP